MLLLSWLDSSNMGNIRNIALSRKFIIVEVFDNNDKSLNPETFFTRMIKDVIFDGRQTVNY